MRLIVPSLRKLLPFLLGGAILGCLCIAMIKFGESIARNAPAQVAAPGHVERASLGAVASAAAQIGEGDLPATQVAFAQAVLGYVGLYRSAPNELKKSALRARRASDIRTALRGNLRFDSWVGSVKEMGTNGDGDASLEVDIANDNLRLKTWSNSVSDRLDRTMIKAGSALYDVVSELKEGQAVKVSGTFIPSERDFVNEVSVSEMGSMTEPEFVVRFSLIAPK